MRKKIQSWLKSFRAVSVRDEASQNICEKQLKTRASLVVDPTLLLDKNEYEKLFEGNIPTEQYCVLYHLAGRRRVDFKTIKKFCKDNSLKLIVIPVNDVGISNAVYPRIGNWLKLIANASFIITNSFHGTVFAMLFQRKFVTILESNTLSNRNIRITSLLSSFHSTNRIWNYNSSLQEIYKTEGFSFNENDKLFIQHSLNYLKENLQ